MHVMNESSFKTPQDITKHSEYIPIQYDSYYVTLFFLTHQLALDAVRGTRITLTHTNSHFPM